MVTLTQRRQILDEDQPNVKGSTVTRSILEYTRTLRWDLLLDPTYTMIVVKWSKGYGGNWYTTNGNGLCSLGNDESQKVNFLNIPSRLTIINRSQPASGHLAPTRDSPMGFNISFARR